MKTQLKITPSKSVITGRNGTVAGLMALAQSIERGKKNRTMKIEITRGQVYKTKMLSRFSSETKTLSPIKILAHVEGFVIFKRDNEKQAVETKSFISTYLKACKYKLC